MPFIRTVCIDSHIHLFTSKLWCISPQHWLWEGVPNIFLLFITYFSQTNYCIQASFIGTKSFSNPDTSKKCSAPFRKGPKALSGACSADRAAVKVGLGWKPVKCALPTSYDRRGETQPDFLLAFPFLHDCFLFRRLMLKLFKTFYVDSFTCPLGCTVVVATNLD